MLFHTNPNVKSVCHKIGVAGICISQGFAKLPKKEEMLTALYPSLIKVCSSSSLRKISSSTITIVLNSCLLVLSYIQVSYVLSACSFYYHNINHLGCNKYSKRCSC